MQPRHFAVRLAALALILAAAVPTAAIAPGFFARPRGGIPGLRDAVADKPTSRSYVSKALRKLEEDEPLAAIGLSARALELDPSDEAALSTLKLAETQLSRKLAQPPYRDAVSAQPPPAGLAAASRPTAPPPEREAPRARAGFWRLVFSPVVCLILLAAAICHILLGRYHEESLVARAVAAPASGPVPAAPAPGLPPGYRFSALLGEGGMGVVCEAEDLKLGRKVAIKKMRDEVKRDPREREHFLQEARLVAGLHHPNIVEIHTIVEDADDLALVFEYVEGKTVERLLAERRWLPLEETKAILGGVCEALDFAHRGGVVHRDLKPSNIMVTSEGVVKVMDFGVARRAKDSLQRFTTTRTIAGTPPYMPPEAEDGIVRKEADVYALGACLYEMVTGEHPFPSPTSRAAKLSLRYVPPSRQRDGLPGGLDTLVDWALQPDPDRRLPSPREFRRRLDALG